MTEVRPSLVHAIFGRSRFRIPRLRRDAEYAQNLRARVESERGVCAVRLNAGASSIVVSYDPCLLTNADILAVLMVLPAKPSRLPVRRKDAVARSHVGALLAGAVALGLAAFGAAPWLTVLCLAASTVPVVLRAAHELRARRLSVDFLDALAIVILAWRGSLWPASLSAMLIAGGEYIRALTARRSRAVLVDLFGTRGQLAWVVRGERPERVPAETLGAGDIVVVYPGELILVDGTVTRGEAIVDQKSLTGESKPLMKRPGDSVFASTFVTAGQLSILTERAGRQTRADRIVQLLEEAPVHDTAIANYAARFADRFVLPTLLAGTAIFLLTRNPVRAAAVIVFDFATGIRVSVPTTVLAAMSAAAVRRNVLIKGGRAIEQLARVDTIVFDKTGTLTSGAPSVIDVGSVEGGTSPDEVLSVAAAVELRLTHPAAHAIVSAAHQRGLAIPDRRASAFAVGLGVSGEVEGQRVEVGSAQHLERAGIPIEAEAAAAAEIAGKSGASTVFVARGGRTIGWIAYADVARSEARDVLQALRAQGVRRLLMLTGDQPDVAAAVAREVGIDRVEAGVFPERKAEVVRALQERGHVVAVVGDGINDSPALGYADVSISLKDSSDVARESADVVLHDDLWGVVDALDVARHAMRVIRDDLTLVAVPNAVGFALACTGFVSPTLATALNNGSAVAAALNGLRPLSYPRSHRNGQLPRAQPSAFDAWRERLTFGIAAGAPLRNGRAREAETPEKGAVSWRGSSVD